jgi:diguanylate cyclase (GGDEF)-like protein
MLIRWGGEEFLLVLPNTAFDRAREVIARVRQHGFGFGPDETPITASIGVAEALTDGVADAATLIRLADERMYLAKESGRNCVVWEHRQAAPVAFANRLDRSPATLL